MSSKRLQQRLEGAKRLSCRSLSYLGVFSVLVAHHFFCNCYSVIIETSVRNEAPASTFSFPGVGLQLEQRLSHVVPRRQDACRVAWQGWVRHLRPGTLLKGQWHCGNACWHCHGKGFRSTSKSVNRSICRQMQSVSYRLSTLFWFQSIARFPCQNYKAPAAETPSSCSFALATDLPRGHDRFMFSRLELVNKAKAQIWFYQMVVGSAFSCQPVSPWIHRSIHVLACFS